MTHLKYLCPICKFETRNLELHNKTWHPEALELDNENSTK